jgi:glycosyltransferase involved in cell wall biosynthesis
MEPLSAETVGVVAIGRNEGERLRRCLASAVDRAAAVVYVDSGSTDGSVELARSLGAAVVELDLDIPFTAARARNAGLTALRRLHPEASLVQFVDGDCELVEAWLDAAVAAMLDAPKLAVACGRRCERHPDRSIYNRLCDLEWDTPVGPASACGGDALMRIEALDGVDGYDETLIAGEEPELCLRLAREGWTIHRLDHDMTIHDAAMTRFGQWWTRAARNGYAYGEGRARHGRAPERYRVHEVRSIIEWALLLPALAFALAWATWGVSLLLLLGYVALYVRVRRHRVERGDGPADATLYARYCVLGKFAEMTGVVRSWIDRRLGRRRRIMEYKRPTAGGAT